MKPIPAISTLFSNAAQDMRLKLGLDDTQTKTVVNMLAGVESGVAKLLYYYLVDIQRNLSPFDADPESEGGQLNRMGKLRLNRDQYPATAGVYTASVTGVAGSTVRAGLTFKSDDTSNAPGNLYLLADAYELTGDDDVITLQALEFGSAYLLNTGDTLTPTEPVIGLDDTVTINAITQLPSAAESVELYRSQVVDSYRLLPQGGAKADYRLWSADVPGVQRVYPQVKNGAAGVAQVYVEATPEDSTDGNGTPSDALLQAVGDAIGFSPDTTLETNMRGRRPMTAIPEIDAVTPAPVDVIITGLQTNTTAIQAAIRSALGDYLFTVRPFIAGADLQSDRNDTLTSVKLQSVVDDTIGTANTFLGFTMSVNGVQVNSFQFGVGAIPYLRNINYN